MKFMCSGQQEMTTSQLQHTNGSLSKLTTKVIQLELCYNRSYPENEVVLMRKWSLHRGG